MYTTYMIPIITIKGTQLFTETAMEMRIAALECAKDLFIARQTVQAETGKQLPGGKQVVDLAEDCYQWLIKDL